MGAWSIKTYEANNYSSWLVLWLKDQKKYCVACGLSFYLDTYSDRTQSIAKILRKCHNMTKLIMDNYESNIHNEVYNIGISMNHAINKHDQKCNWINTMMVNNPDKPSK